jgi:hypothetical protein
VDLPQARQAAQSKGDGSLQGDDISAQRDGGGTAPNGKDSEAAGPPTPQLDDLFREGTAWSEGRLPEVRRSGSTAHKACNASVLMWADMG